MTDYDQVGIEQGGVDLKGTEYDNSAEASHHPNFVNRALPQRRHSGDEIKEKYSGLDPTAQVPVSHPLQAGIRTSGAANTRSQEENTDTAGIHRRDRAHAQLALPGSASRQIRDKYIRGFDSFGPDSKRNERRFADVAQNSFNGEIYGHNVHRHSDNAETAQHIDSQRLSTRADGEHHAEKTQAHPPQTYRHPKIPALPPHLTRHIN